LHGGGQFDALLLSIASQLFLEPVGQRLLCPVGRSDEAVQVGAFEEVTQNAESGESREIEEEVECKYELSEELFSGRALEEVDDGGFESLAVVVVEPLSECGWGNVLFACELSL
jgi:hypothetical protein